MSNASLIFGAQYYRAPTPPPEDWARDLDQFAASGFNTIKIWAQWRWNNSRQGEFDFGDLDALMDCAHEHSLQVIINVIFDCAPAWLFRQFPECRMVTSTGRVLGPTPTGWRQIGGAPGPCLNHPEARQLRYDFLSATVRRFALHPALLLWDVWNEPELSCGLLREPKVENLLCYCDACRAAFLLWLQEQYPTLGALNRRWGRNYRAWDEVELPVEGGAIGDMLDWRAFQMHTLAEECRQRVAITRQLDRQHPIMCHTVPAPAFNPVICASDDWALAAPCDLVGNSVGSEPFAADLLRSAGDDKVAINAEIHALSGSTLARPQPQDLPAMQRHIFGPLARGIKGFVFWQYRPELLGTEAPAWGLTHPDGTPAPWHRHAQRLNDVLQQQAHFFRHAQPQGPVVGVLFHPLNHVLHWCARGDLALADRALQGVYRALYQANFQVRFLHPLDFAAGHQQQVRVIFAPFIYLLDAATAEALRAWVAAGGTLISDCAFLNYNRETNRHATVSPGLGFDAVFGVREELVYPTGNLASAAAAFKINRPLGPLPVGHQLAGAWARCPLELRGAEIWGEFADGSPALTMQCYEQGRAVYCGTALGLAAEMDANSATLIAALAAQFEPAPRPEVMTAPGAEVTAALLRVDLLEDGRDGGTLRQAVVIQNSARRGATITLQLPGVSPTATLRHALDGNAIAATNGCWRLEIAPEIAELFLVEN
jgi:beta-galactosidase